MRICNLYRKLLCKSFVLTCFLVQCLLHVTWEYSFRPISLLHVTLGIFFSSYIYISLLLVTWEYFFLPIYILVACHLGILFPSYILVASGDISHSQLFTQLERIFPLSNPRKILFQSSLQFWYIIINIDIDIHKYVH